MTALFVVVLQFTEGGPATLGEWAVEDTARRTHRRWVGLYGGQAVAIQLVEETVRARRVLREWTPQDEFVAERASRA
ncbi:hypothetical protein [Streptomyces sp. NBC_01244]|uniref:hypothetical protein n=1 Tax=Streptomyces sp. NBC_01244 TaxID=2903797 RepID=UPI002E145DB8|nr:hypothetical protein OG247_00210 [Streptomyces sp. NBC_01244]